MRFTAALLTLLLALATTKANAAEENTPLQFVELVSKASIEGATKSAIGVTRRGTSIDSLLGDDDLDYQTSKTRVLLVGGLDGSRASAAAVVEAMRAFYTSKTNAGQRRRFTLSAVPLANPDGLASGQAPANGSGGNPLAGYPPAGNAYNSPTDPEAAYLWRWIGMHAPDLVVEVREGEKLQWHQPPSEDEPLGRLAKELDAQSGTLADDELAAQIVKTAPCETGTIPALRVDVSKQTEEFLPSLLAAIEESGFRSPSPARREIRQRLDRVPRQVAAQLSKHYGHDLKQVVYIPALALVGRVRLGEMTGDAAHLKDVERIAAPYFNGDKPTDPKSGSGLSGHLVFCELARLSDGERRKRYVELAKNAADLAFDASGKLRPSMPYHSEMSDALFMGGPILARVGKLTGETKYYDACSRHLAFMRKLVLRDDGIYRHSPLDEAAWGRGNGFPALGMAMVLTDFPADHPQGAELLAAYQSHMAALAEHQDPTGAWHQVIDLPESYRELTSTCMITFAMIRGVRNGWLDDDQYRPVIRRAWQAILTRVPANGRLVDVCTGTGKQKNLRAYYDRTAILGPDARGGAMALMVATEMAAWHREKEAE